MIILVCLFATSCLGSGEMIVEVPGNGIQMNPESNVVKDSETPSLPEGDGGQGGEDTPDVPSTPEFDEDANENDQYSEEQDSMTGKPPIELPILPAE